MILTDGQTEHCCELVQMETWKDDCAVTDNRMAQFEFLVEKSMEKRR